jgi:hypothetical protein
MDSFLSVLAQRITEFIARDAVYICSGAVLVAGMIALFSGIDIAQTVNKDVPLTLLIVVLPFLHVIGFACRSIAEIVGLVTIAIPDESSVIDESGRVKMLAAIFLNASRFPFKLDSGPGYRGTEVEIVDSYLSFQPKDAESRTYAMYKRALFLKEITATCGSSVALLAAVSLFSIAADPLRLGEQRASIAFSFFLMLVVGVFVCRLSVYHACRQGNFLKAMIRQLMPTTTKLPNVATKAKPA